MKTGAVLIRELRYMLDEPLEVKWSDEALYQYLNDGLSQVTMMLKSSENRWHVRVLNTASSPLTIYGATYTPSTALVCANNGSTITLPRDCLEILHLYAENQVDRTAGYEFNPSRLSRHRFETLSAAAVDSTRRVYFYTFQGQTTLKIAPILNSQMEFELHYVYAPADIVSTSDVDQVPEWAYLAVKLYAKHLAFQAISHPETVPMYKAWEAEIKKLQNHTDPRTNPKRIQVVEGAYDEEDSGSEPNLISR